MRLLTLFLAGLLSVSQVLAFQGTTPQESPEVPRVEKKPAAEKPSVEEKPADGMPAKTTLPAGVVRVETVWVDDDLPKGVPARYRGKLGGWDWVSQPDHPVKTGKRSVRVAGLGQNGAAAFRVNSGFPIRKGDRVFAHVFVKDDVPASTVAFRFYTHFWRFGAIWGHPGPLILDRSYLRAGKVPPKGKWVRLEVDAIKAGLAEGHVLRGLSFQNHGSDVYWDQIGISHIALKGVPDSHVTLNEKGQVERLILRGGKVNDTTLDSVVGFAELNSLDLSGSQITVAGLKKLQQLKKLSDLTLDGCVKVNDESLDELTKISSLTSLNLSGTGITNEGVPSLLSAFGLEKLKLRGIPVADSGASVLVSLPGLKSLDLHGTKIGDEGAEAIAQHFSLTELDITNTSVSGSTVQKLRARNGQLTIHHSAEDALKRVGVTVKRNSSGTPFSVVAGVPQNSSEFKGRFNRLFRDSSMKHLAQLGPIRTVYLSHTFTTDESLKLVAQIPTVDKLNLYSTGITDAGLAQLKPLQRLREIVLNFSNIGDDGLKHLTEFPALTYLTLSHTAVTDKGMVHIGKMTSLRTLYLFDQPITDEGIAHLVNLKSLRFLSLHGTQVSDAGLQFLSSMKSLKTLYLYETNVTKAGLAQLRKNLRGCRIYAAPHPVTPPEATASDAPNQPSLIVKSHTGRVQCVAFSRDSSLMASGATDGTVRITEVATGKLVRVLTGHNSSVSDVAFHPDGKRLATAGGEDRSVCLWSLETGGILRVLRGHTDYAKRVSFSPKGDLLASAAHDNSLRIWNTETGKSQQILAGHTDKVNGLDFHIGGQLVASAGRDRTVRLWNAKTGKETLTIRGHTGWIPAVKFSPDGGLIASGSVDKTVRLWSAKDGTLLSTLKGHELSINGLAFSSDGLKLASASSDFTVRLWDPITGNETHTLFGHTGRVTQVAISPDDKYLASASFDETVRVWELEKLAP